MWRACDLLANLPDLLALMTEATPASLPLLLNSVPLSVINVGSGRKMLSSECGKLPWKFHLFVKLMGKRRQSECNRVTVGCLGLGKLA